MSHEHVLLVEGINDLHAVRNLVFRHGILVHYEHDRKQETSPEECVFEIKQAGGIESDEGGVDNLSRMIQSHLKTDDVLILGVIADADDEPAASWEGRINDLFRFDGRAFTSLEDYDVREGWVGEAQNSIGDPVRVGVWIMPDNKSEGALEDFAARLIPAQDESQELWEHAVEWLRTLTFECLRTLTKERRRCIPGSPGSGSPGGRLEEPFQPGF